MTDQAAERLNLLNRRLTLVARVSALNAEALKLTQSLSGVEMEVLRCELEIARNGHSDELVRELHEANGRAEAIGNARAKCEERIAATESEIGEIDRALAGLDAD